MIRYCAPFLFVASVPVFFYAGGPVAPLLTVAALLAALIGAEFLSALAPDMRNAGRSHLRLLPLAYVPAQLLVLAWAMMEAAGRDLPVGGFAALVLSVGVTAGVFGMLAAHELAHSPNRTHRLFALAMLTGMTYRHFRIAHLYGHHRWAGTLRDPATARLGESFYRFLLRTIAGQWHEAWLFEERRRMARGLPAMANRVLIDALAMMALYVAVAAAAGWRGALFFGVQSAIAVVVLELFNYIAHYGLRRAVDAGGRPEPLSHRHSWNSSNAIANLMIFNMGRHSDHHRRPSAAFEGLTPVADAPELPAGYAGSILLALVPPLWRRVMDERVLRLRSLRTDCAFVPV